MRPGLSALGTRGSVVSVREEGGQQFVTVRGFAGERIVDALRIEPHGFASVPLAESEGLLLNLGGRRPQPVLLGFEHPAKRPTGLPEGAAALYDAHGNILKLLGSTGAELRIDGPFVLELKEVRIVAESLVIECPDIRLGGEGGARVSTEAGPAQRVWAV